MKPKLSAKPDCAELSEERRMIMTTLAEQFNCG